MTQANVAAVQPSDMKQAWTALREDNPGVRIREAASQLQVSEMELIATGCGDSVTRLEGDWKAVISDLPSLGEVMALTRNDYAVHEKIGLYGNISFSGNMGLVLNDAIDLRLFMSHWHHGFAVTEQASAGERHSLQFFDASGTAVHKVYLTDASDYDAYQSLVGAYRARDQSQEQSVLPAPVKPGERDDSEIDVHGMHAHWNALKDTHEFQDLLRQFGVTRTQALRLAGRDLANPVDPSLVSLFLETLSEQQLEIMVFVASRGVVQIHSGPIRNLKRTGPWFNVLDETFSLHLREDAVAKAWVVRKPTVDGVVSSLELYDADGGTIALLFGKRKPGLAENEAWRRILEALPEEEGT